MWHLWISVCEGVALVDKPEKVWHMRIMFFEGVYLWIRVCEGVALVDKPEKVWNMRNMVFEGLTLVDQGL
jgi:hypothetical protein